MSLEQVGDWLDELASAAPAPGGGAAAALSASAGACLIAMVCNLTIGKPKYAAVQAQMTAALASAETARRAALALAQEDATAFEAVIAAYQLPRATEEEKRARTAAVQDALAGAAAVPLRAAALAADVIGLAQEILDGANTQVISDVAVAASLARAALESSQVNVEVNLALLTPGEVRTAIAAELAGHLAAAGRAEAVIGAVRDRISA